MENTERLWQEADAFGTEAYDGEQQGMEGEIDKCEREKETKERGNVTVSDR